MEVENKDRIIYKNVTALLLYLEVRTSFDYFRHNFVIDKENQLIH